MPFMDKLKQAVKGRSAMVEQGIDKAVAQVNKRTGGKYSGTLTKRAADLKSRARRLDEQRHESDRQHPRQERSQQENPEPPRTAN